MTTAAQPHAADPGATRYVPLLTLITEQSLDEDYRTVAARRSATGESPVALSRRTRHAAAALVVGVFGLVATIVAVQTSEQEGVATAGRDTLISQIDARRNALARLQQEILSAREQDVRLQARLDRVSTAALAAEERAQRYGVVTGFQAVRGPGVRVTVDDRPDGAAQVRDADLRPLVNGLWQAGAEAIAVNGERLTARSAIRNSGVTIRIAGNSANLTPPYVVTAIGDPRTLQADLMQTTGGLTFRSIAQDLGFPMSMDNVDDLTLPAAPPRLERLLWAQDATRSTQPSSKSAASQTQKETLP